jgi:trehalose 6-phosphate phosphatase
MADEESQSVVKPLEELDGFWDRVASSKRRLLGLDYDGTLAPFDPDRMQAKPMEGAVDLIREIDASPGTRVAIFSGRPVSEIKELLGDLDITIVGSHGNEIKEPGLEIEEFLPTPIQKIGLERGIEMAKEYNPGDNLEIKVASIAMHTRPLPEDEARRVEEELLHKWSDFSDAYELICRRFNGGVELRAAGWDKGSALMRIVRVERPTMTVYIGDDDTDEDAFDTVSGMGVGIKVGDGNADTQAQAYLPGPPAVLDFLRKWKSVTSGET